MYISIEDLFERFKKEHSQEFNLKDRELYSACVSQFEQIKQTMESNVLEDIRLQYLFTVRVKNFRIIKNLKNTFINFEKKITSEKSFKKYAVLLLDYVHRNPTKFKKYEEVITEVTGFTPQDIHQQAYKENPGRKFNSQS
jgi:hypothetical protein